MDLMTKQGTTKPQVNACLDRDQLREHLSQKIFPLQPKDYGEQYPIWPGAVGLEVESIPIYTSGPGSTRAALPMFGRDRLPARPAHSSENNSREEQGFDRREYPPSGLVEALKAQAADEPTWRMQTLPAEDLPLGIDIEGAGNLSFEPGAQLEISTKPFPCLTEAAKHLTQVQASLDHMSRQHDFELLQIGINPWQTVSEVGLQMPKRRYQAMHSHFSEISEYGPMMMRLTATIQVNLDFGPDETTLAKRYLASNLIAPFAMAMFSYSGFYQGRRHELTNMRARIWRHTDPSRTGFPKLLDVAKGFHKRDCIEHYLDYALAARVVFLARKGYERPKQVVSFASWLASGIDGQFPDLSDWETHLSLLFPEVRPKGFLELRSVDSQSRVWQLVPAAFYIGLLYDDQSLDRSLELLLPLQERIFELWQRSEQGLKDPTLKEITLSLANLSVEGLSRVPECFYRCGIKERLSLFVERMTQNGRSPIDDLEDFWRKSGKNRLDIDDIRRTEDNWSSWI